jgi:iron complex outermembrane receptor protein
MNFIKSILLAFLIAGFAIGQDSPDAPVQGTIADHKGNFVKGAVIIAECKGVLKTISTQSDDKGKYSFVLPVGRCEFRVTAKDGDFVRTFAAELRTIKSGMINTRDFTLTQVSSIRENVDVNISTGTEQPFSEVSKTVDSVDGKQIEERGETTVIDTLRTVPGFRIQQLGGLGRTAGIKTRGLRNQDTAVLLDGQRLRDPASITGDASAFVSDLNTVNVGRIEVLRGSGSSVYGTNAIGGVIDIQTPRGSKGFKGSFGGEYGNLGFSRIQGTTGYGTSDGRFGFTAGMSRLGVTKGLDGEDDANNTTLRMRIDFNPIDRLSLSGKMFFSDSFVRLNGNPDTFGSLPAGGVIDAAVDVNFIPDANDPDNFQRSDFFAGQLNAALVVNEKFVVSAYYHGLSTGRENENGGLGPGFQPFGGIQLSFFDGSIHDIGAKADIALNRNVRFVAGYEFELEKYSNEGFGPTPGGEFFTRVNQSSNTAFAQILFSALNKRLQIAGGLRLQAFSLSSPEFSVQNGPYSNLTIGNPPSSYTFDGAISYYFEETKTKLRLHIGNGYRVPSLYERFGSFFSSFSQSFTALGEPNLEPERSIAFDAGIDQDFAAGRVSLSATYFYTQLSDTIGYGNDVADIDDTPRPFGGYLNTKGGIARGLEMSARFAPTRFTSLFTTYTFTNSDQREPQVTGSGILRTLGIPDHRFTLIASQRIGSRFTVSFDLETSSNYLAPIFSNTSFSNYVYRFEGNRRGDVSARYELPVFNEKAKASFFSTFENLFGNTYFENGFATQGRTARAGVSIEF